MLYKYIMLLLIMEPCALRACQAEVKKQVAVTGKPILLQQAPYQTITRNRAKNCLPKAEPLSHNQLAIFKLLESIQILKPDINKLIATYIPIDDTFLPAMMTVYILPIHIFSQIEYLKFTAHCVELGGIDHNKRNLSMRVYLADDTYECTYKQRNPLFLERIARHTRQAQHSIKLEKMAEYTEIQVDDHTKNLITKLILPPHIDHEILEDFEIPIVYVIPLISGNLMIIYANGIIKIFNPATKICLFQTNITLNGHQRLNEYQFQGHWQTLNGRYIAIACTDICIIISIDEDAWQELTHMSSDKEKALEDLIHRLQQEQEKQDEFNPEIPQDKTVLVDYKSMNNYPHIQRNLAQHYPWLMQQSSWNCSIL